MRAAKHTPGPWVWDRCSVSDFGREYPCSMSMEWIPNGRFGDSDDDNINRNVEQDARLIAAAPELLEALEKAARNIDAMAQALRSEQLLAAGNRAAGWADEARAAIAKARGEA